MENDFTRPRNRYTLNFLLIVFKNINIARFTWYSLHNIPCGQQRIREHFNSRASKSRRLRKKSWSMHCRKALDFSGRFSDALVSSTTDKIDI